MVNKKINYGTAILHGFEYLLENHKEVFVLGQGLWSPWYVGNSMIDLDKKFGADRVIDTPVSELACTGAAVGASLCGTKPIVVHPRMDFMMYAMDAIINQASKWSSMTGGQANPCVTIRAIINRGGEQGAQHSQALQSIFSHIPGLRVVMPSTTKDARDFLISSVLCPDPVLYIDDRWLYENEDYINDVEILDLKKQKPQILKPGSDLTIVGSGYASFLSLEASKVLHNKNISCEVIDLRVLSPLDSRIIFNSVLKNKKIIGYRWRN